jgi:hypothetical protein
MEAQGLSQGSLRNSHRETHAIQRKPAPASLQNPAIKVLEGCHDNLVIRQRLDAAQVEGLLKKGTFYVLPSEGIASPGFLVFQSNKPAVYLQWRKGGWSGTTLRMRVAASLGEGGGTILVGTLDDVTHTLRLEDVWMWKGKRLFASDTYSARRQVLKEFVESHWVPDARLLGGIFTQIAAPMSLEEFSQKEDWTGVTSLEFLPEQPGRRRMVFTLEARKDVRVGPAGMKQQRTAPAGAPRPAPATATVAAAPPAPITLQQPSPQPSEAVRRARAVPVEKMPDVYDLYGEDGFPISRASVQQFALSQLLRGKLQTSPDVWVQARWRAEFGGYEILGAA